MLDPTVYRKSLFSYLRWDCGAPNPYAILGEFLGTYFPNIAYGFGGPRRASSPIYRTDLDDTRRWPAPARENLPFRPYLHARISRITVVEQLPQMIIFFKIIG